MKVRTRFAPSPTGYLHVGGIRTALFAWLVARQAGGQFILRLEDTDKKREVAGAEKHIEDSLKALGLDYDEGPDIGGPFSPYRQSERLDSYKKWAQKLIDAGRAYADPRTEEELNRLRGDAKSKKKPFLIRHYPLDKSFDWRPGVPLRFKALTDKDLSHDAIAATWHDEVMGDIGYTPEALDDFILIKSDGFPTYNFGHIIDDQEMDITHVIRGQEFLPSVPNYLNLYEALGLERPVLATLPHILGPDGKKKLSKRDGAKDVLDYIRDGYLPEALVSFIATLGWNDGTEQEIFTIQELIDKFELGRVQRSGAKFDEKRLEWVDGSFIRQTPLETLAKTAEDYWPPAAAGAGQDYKQAVLALVQERLKYLSELPELTEFFFKEPTDRAVKELFEDPVDKRLKKLGSKDIIKLLNSAKNSLEKSDFSEGDITKRLNGLLTQLNTKPGVLFATIRIAITGAKSSPEIFGTLKVLGKEKSLARLEQSLTVLS